MSPLKQTVCLVAVHCVTFGALAAAAVMGLIADDWLAVCLAVILAGFIAPTASGHWQSLMDCVEAFDDLCAIDWDEEAA